MGGRPQSFPDGLCPFAARVRIEMEIAALDLERNLERITHDGTDILALPHLHGCGIACG